MARCAVAVCHMHGIIIRRVGFLHSGPMRPAVVAALHLKRTNGATTAGGTQQDSAVWRERLHSPAMQIWLGLIDKMSHGLRSRTSISDTHHLDSLSLYAAATSQYSQGIRNLYAVLGHPSAEQVDLVGRLNTAADVLRGYIEHKRGELRI